jgi:hypothetical protein
MQNFSCWGSLAGQNLGKSPENPYFMQKICGGIYGILKMMAQTKIA